MRCGSCDSHIDLAPGASCRNKGCPWFGMKNLPLWTGGIEPSPEPQNPAAGRPAFKRPTRPVFYMSGLGGGRPFGPHHELTVWLPIACLVDSPGDADPAAMFRWLAEKAEQGELDRLTIGSFPVPPIDPAPIAARRR